jgi:pimeloyl-ACP methyl ester carboxylesterase
MAAKALRFDVTTRPSAHARTMIFVHGWPDTPVVFQKQHDAFSLSHRVVTLSVPGYLRGGAGLPFFGHSFPAVIEALRLTIVDVMAGRDEKPVVVAHDWGSLLVFMVERTHPELFDRIVGLDVAGHVGKKEGAALKFLCKYQLVLCVLYLLPAIVGTPLTRWYTGNSDTAVHAGMNFLYFRQWLTLLLGNRVGVFAPWQAPTVPVLFLYSIALFHSPQWAAHLEAADGSSIREVKGGHWFFRGDNAAAVNEHITAFMSK